MPLMPMAHAVPQATPKEVDPNESGRQRLTAITTSVQNRNATFNGAQVDYAQSLNLVQDLNIPQIVEFFGCKTLIGKQYLTDILSSPINPKDKSGIVESRRNCIKALIENPALKREVEQALNEAREQEQEIITLFSEFFIGKTCPELKQLDLIKEQNPQMYPVAKFLTTNRTGKTVAFVSNSISAVGTALGTAFWVKNFGSDIKNKRDFTASGGVSAYFGLMCGLTGYAAYQDYSLGSQKRTKMHALNRFIAIAEKTEDMCKANTMQKQFKLQDIRTKEGLSLVRGLKDSRYKSKNMVLFNIPAVHSFLYTVYDHQNHLALLFASIAELDAYNALATKMLNAQNGNNKLCFVTYLPEEKPTVQATNFWNVLVPNAVPSSISEDRHIILTGPNAGGKTTSIRALLQNIVLGQTFGIAAADSFAFTPFDVIESFLNISDDLMQGDSLFKSEVKRAQGILQKIKLLQPNQKYFFALDELFTGTQAAVGEQCAYSFIKRINTSNGVQFIYATHFDKLTELAQESARTTNYKVDAPSKDANGKLVYPFTVSQGKNEVNVALDIAKEAGLFEE